MNKLCAIVVSAFILSGCATTYERVDRAPVDARALQAAKLVCNGEKDAVVGGMPSGPDQGVEAAAAGARKLSTALSVYSGCMARQGYVEAQSQ